MSETARNWRKAGEASGIARAKKAGLPVDAPRDKWGRRCIEKVCPICGRTFLAGPSTIGRTCSHKCAGVLKRQRGGAYRRGKANPAFKHGERVGFSDQEQQARWRAAMVDYCENPACHGPGGVLALHHVVYRQHVRAEHGDQWDPANAMTLCTRCHLSHHRRYRVLPAAAVPSSARAFAVELFGSEEKAQLYFERYYDVGEELAA